MSDSVKLSKELTDAISVDGGIKFHFPEGSDEQLRKFAGLGESQDVTISPILTVRCFNKQSIEDLVAKARRYDEAIGLGGVIVAVPEPMDKGVTQKAYADAQAKIQHAFPQKPFLMVAHERNDFEGKPINPFDAPLNLAAAIVHHQKMKYGIHANSPMFYHSYGPNLTDEQLENVRLSLQKSPYLLSVRTKEEGAKLPVEMTVSIAALREHLDDLPSSLPAAHIYNLKQLFRNTLMSWGSNDLIQKGGFNRLHSGESVSIDHLPHSIKPVGYDGMVLKGAGGEEDTELLLRLADDAQIREVLRSLLNGPVVTYTDPDVHPERKDKYERAWNTDPHPAHPFMFPQIAETTEHKAGIAVRQKIRDNGGVIPEDWRGVRFV